jgi:hypothetical protein
MPRLPNRLIVLAATLLLSIVSLLRFEILPTIVVLTAGVTLALLVGRHHEGRFKLRRGRGKVPAWKPAVQHSELPLPKEDPPIGYGEPTLEQFADRLPPLANLAIDGALRTQLDGFALGRAKRIIEAPELLPHAAADPESWPVVEAAVQKTLELARARGVEFNPEGQRQLQSTLALSAAQGVLLAEWRQLDDGVTGWSGATAQVRASDAFAIQRICEATERGQLPDLFAGIARRPQNFEVRWLAPYALSTAFYLRLRGRPPHSVAA